MRLARCGGHVRADSIGTGAGQTGPFHWACKGGHMPGDTLFTDDLSPLRRACRRPLPVQGKWSTRFPCRALPTLRRRGGCEICNSIPARALRNYSVLLNPGAVPRGRFA